VVNGLGFLIRGLGVQESGLDQDPYQKKYTSTSITRVPVVQIEQMRAHLKGLSARIVMSSESMVTCDSGLLPNPAKVQYFQYRAWWYSIVQKFHNYGKKKFKNHNFEPILAYGHDPAKVTKFQNWTWWYSIDWKFHTDD
jgi:hypothetical protein